MWLPGGESQQHEESASSPPERWLQQEARTAGRASRWGHPLLHPPEPPCWIPASTQSRPAWTAVLPGGLLPAGKIACSWGAIRECSASLQCHQVQIIWPKGSWPFSKAQKRMAAFPGLKRRCPSAGNWLGLGCAWPKSWLPGPAWGRALGFPSPADLTRDLCPSEASQ